VLVTLILLAATVLAWVGYRHTQAPQPRAKAWAVATACLIGLTLPVAFGFTISQTGQVQWKTVEMELSQLQIKGLDQFDLRRGAYLIILMDTGCLHCQEAVPELNALAEAAELPAVIGLFMNEESERKAFVEKFQPLFSIGQIEKDIFWRLLDKGEIPRIMLVSDRRVKKVWDETVPTAEMIREENP
jgi:thiol-disulfide isomerase/thioredoxin